MSNGNNDVEFSVGANITPYQQKMAQVKAAATATGESMGLEFDRGAYMAERRVDRGMKSIITSITSAKNPAEALSGVIEGIGQAGRIAGAMFIGAGIGSIIADQLTKAGNAAITLTKQLGELQSFNVAGASSAELDGMANKLQGWIDNLDNRTRGQDWMMRYLWGQDPDAAQAEFATRLEQLQTAASAARAKLTRDDTAILSAPNAKDKAQAEVDKIKDEYRNKENAPGVLREEGAALEQEKLAKIKEVWDKYEAEIVKNWQETNDKIEEASKKSRQEAERNAERAAEITAEQTNRQGSEQEAQATNGHQRAVVLSWEADQIAARAAATTDQLEKERLLTAEQEKRNAAVKEEADYKKEQAELAQKRIDLQTEQKSAQSDLTTARVDDMTFHGQVSSLRKLGFGRAPAASGHEMQALKAAQQAVDRLDKLQREVKALNDKIGGAA